MVAERIKVVLVDDRPDVVDLLQLRFSLDRRFEVVGTGFTGVDALQLCKSLRPAALVLDLDMPVLSGQDVIPLVRAASPETQIVVFTASAPAQLAEAGAPDALVVKGGELKGLLETIVRLTGTDLQNEIIEVDLGDLPLESAVAAFDSWVGLHVRIREALSRKPVLTAGELNGISAVDLLALNGLFLRIGVQLVRAAQAGQESVHIVLKTRRKIAAATRRALVILGDEQVLKTFYDAWGYEAVPASSGALQELRHRLIAQLPQ